MSYRAKLWVEDDRPKDQRNKNGRRKLPNELVAEGPVAMLESLVQAFAQAPKGRQEAVRRIVIDHEDPADASGLVI